MSRTPGPRPETIVKFNNVREDVHAGMSIKDALAKHKLNKMTYRLMKHKEDGTTPRARGPNKTKHKVIDLPLHKNQPSKVAVIVCEPSQLVGILEGLQ